MKPIENFYLEKDEPVRSCLITLHQVILSQDTLISCSWSYKMPFFCYKGKPFCYLWYHKKYQQPYIGFVEGFRFQDEFLLQEKRSRMKIMLIDSTQDLPILQINDILQRSLDLYRHGVIKT
ncbi:MAG: DUF1801 domain-containing protein [Cytophagales bacterium]|nr:MAG: DUF1801 domain-containing protein [Cytophagales bacterium]TAF59708.1 MAG: DUF1801 domain-containing protein [Cytophagales bacterium]